MNNITFLDMETNNDLCQIILYTEPYIDNINFTMKAYFVAEDILSCAKERIL